ncbi:MAG TPA: hypothetical protein PKU97_05595 [Kofleriaceae bacterium]|nr:hypothetical protein [Kofleriaceae bacterium]
MTEPPGEVPTAPPAELSGSDAAMVAAMPTGSGGRPPAMPGVPGIIDGGMLGGGPGSPDGMLDGGPAG